MDHRLQDRVEVSLSYSFDIPSAHPGSQIVIERGRNADVVEYKLVKENQTIVRMARYYGFRNIQNLVRRLRPAKVSRLAAAGKGEQERWVEEQDRIQG